MTETIPAKIYFIKDAEELTRRNRQTLRRWWEKNQFPKPTLISNRLAWEAQTLHHWIKESFPQGQHG